MVTTATLRLFIAIEIPAEIRKQIAQAASPLKSLNTDVRWEQFDKLHVTLKFLGDTNGAVVPSIVSSLEKIAAQAAPFSLKCAMLGCFPGRREPKIIWVGIEDPGGALESLAGAIDSSMSEFGFAREQRKFSGHVTIGRVKSQRNMGDLIRTMESITFESQPTSVAQIVLIRSELKPGGSVYTTLNRVPLSRQQT